MQTATTDEQIGRARNVRYGSTALLYQMFGSLVGTLKVIYRYFVRIYFITDSIKKNNGKPFVVQGFKVGIIIRFE